LGGTQVLGRNAYFRNWKKLKLTFFGEFITSVHVVLFVPLLTLSQPLASDARTLEMS